MSGTTDPEPSSPLLAALRAVSSGAPVLPANSRYQGLPTRTAILPDGRSVTYLARRIVLASTRFAIVASHVMAPFERLDQVAARLLGDPLLAWRLADANNALDPAALERTGRSVAIPLPAGVPGPANA